MKKLDTSEQPYVIVPIPLDGYWGSDVDLIANKIIEAYEKYGLHRFSLAAPSNGQFNIGYADRTYYEKMTVKNYIYIFLKNGVKRKNLCV